MGHGPGIMQREILRRARGAFTVRDVAQKLYLRFDDSKLGAVRRAMRGLETMGYLSREHPGQCPGDGRYRRTAQRQPTRREWRNDIGPARITLADANAMLEGKHYLGSMNGWHVDYCLATPARDALAMFKAPVATSFTAALTRPLELTRLWRADDCPFPASQFLAATLKWIKRTAKDVDCVFSYADPEARDSATGRQHSGGVYIAANFVYLGKSQAMPYWIKPDGSSVSARAVQRRLGTKDRAKVAALEPSWQHVPGEAKLLYVYPMATTISGIRAKLGTGRYRHTLLPPQPWD
jgi:hypothetical protein